MTNNVNQIDYKEIEYLIKDQLTGIFEENYSYYEGYDFKIAQEQFFTKPSQVDPKTIFIVLKFSPISVHYGQTILPVQIVAVAEQNNIEVCRTLFTELVSKYNLGQNDDETIQQIYESPYIASNFNKVVAGYRSLVTVSATFIVSKNANFYKYSYCYYTSDKNLVEKELKVNAGITIITKDDFEIDADKFVERLTEWGVPLENKTYLISRRTELAPSGNVYVYYFEGAEMALESMDFLKISDEVKNETTEDFVLEIKLISHKTYKEVEIPCVTKSFNGSSQLDTQPFFGSNNLTKSEGKVYTLTYSIITFLLTDIPLANDVIDVMCEERSPFEKFKIKIDFKNGRSLTKEFSLVDWSSRADIGQIPMLVLTFTT